MLEQKILEIITPPVINMGYRLVRVKWLGAKHNPILQIMAERMDDKPMAVEDCEAISRHLSLLLDTNESLTNRYRLEISSPGIDRPLMTPDDFIKNKGLLCSLYLKESSEKGKRLKAVIDDVTKENDGWQIMFLLPHDEPPNHNKAKSKKKKEKFQQKNHSSPSPSLEKLPADNLANENTNGEKLQIAFDNIDSAKLVITDELLRRALKNTEKQNPNNE